MDKRVKRLIDASHNLCSYLARDACRVIAEFPDDENIVPYLTSIPIRVVREFDAATLALTDPELSDDEAEVRAKYERAMQEMRASASPSLPQTEGDA